MPSPLTVLLQSTPAYAWKKTTPLPYTSSPFWLLFSDILLVLFNAWSIPFVVLPIVPWPSGALDELYPSFQNIFDITVHLILAIAQLAFLLSLPLSLFSLVPFNLVIFYFFGFLVTNYYLSSLLLNGDKPILESRVDLSDFPDKHEDEKWVFINGIAAGSHWLQANIDRISLSFGRKVLGVHNPTRGIVFDILQCLIQRDFTYATQDIRNGFAAVKEILGNHNYNKVILILHSQGSIEGGLILDWLYAEAPRELLGKLEVYTFANAANHFNNPARTFKPPQTANGASSENASALPSERAVAHIEHYANQFDFVSRWGVLDFATDRTKKGRTNRFAGRLFERHGKGHLFNQHYLDTMFPLDHERGYGVLEHNPFMDAEAQIVHNAEDGQGRSSLLAAAVAELDVLPVARVLVHDFTFDSSSASVLPAVARHSTRKVWQYSRLWKYRNGMTPSEES